MHCSVLQRDAVWCDVAPKFVICCSVLQCTAVCCTKEGDVKISRRYYRRRPVGQGNSWAHENGLMIKKGYVKRDLYTAKETYKRDLYKMKETYKGYLYTLRGIYTGRR